MDKYPIVKTEYVDVPQSNKKTPEELRLEKLFDKVIEIYGDINKSPFLI